MRDKLSVLKEYFGHDSFREGQDRITDSLLGGRVEALEFLVTADVPHLGESLASVRLQPGILLACISRGAKVLFPGGGDSLQTGDTVIVIAPRERHIAELRQIFDERG